MKIEIENIHDAYRAAVALRDYLADCKESDGHARSCCACGICMAAREIYSVHVKLLVASERARARR